MDAKYVKCSAKYCTNKLLERSDLTFFTFPEDKELAKIWASNSNIAYYYHGSTLCAEHFEDKYFDSTYAKKTVFKENVKPIPTIYNINAGKDIQNPKLINVSFDELSSNISTNLDFGNLISYTNDFPQSAHVEKVNLTKDYILQTKNVSNNVTASDPLIHTAKIKKKIILETNNVEKHVTASDHIIQTARKPKNYILQIKNLSKNVTALDPLIQTVNIEKILEHSQNIVLQSNKTKNVENNVAASDHFIQTVKIDKILEDSQNEVLQSNKTIQYNYCRLCANSLPVDRLHPIYGEPNYSEMLEICLPGKFLKTDKLSQKVCSICVNNLENCSAILKSFIEADKKLKDLLSKTPVSKPSTSHQSDTVLNLDDVIFVPNEVSNVLDISNEVLNAIDVPNEGETIIQEKVYMKFKCLTCSSEFNSQEEVIVHTYHAHPTTRNDKIISKITKTNVGNISDQIKSKTSLQNSKKYQCLICSELLDTKEEVINHTQANHKFTSHNKILTKIIDVRTNQQPVTKLQGNLVKYMCVSCPTIYNSRKEVVDHALLIHPQNKIVSKTILIHRNDLFTNNKTPLLNTSVPFINKTVHTKGNIKDFPKPQEVIIHDIDSPPPPVNKIIPPVINTNEIMPRRPYKKYVPGENPDPVITYQIKYQCKECSVIFNSYKEVFDHYEHLHSALSNKSNTFATVVKVKDTNKAVSNDGQNVDNKENNTADENIICVNDGTIHEIDPNIKLETLKKNIPPKVIFESKFKCIKCFKLFSGKKKLIQHALCSHPTPGLNEIQCKIVKVKKELNQIYHYTWGRYECLICGSHHVGKKGLIKHTRFFHPSVCTNKFLCRLIYSKNILSNNCLHCNAILSNYSRYRQHMRKHVSFNCEECGSKFDNVNDLRYHINMHKKPKLAEKQIYKCMGCEKEFKGRLPLYIHEQIHKIPKDVTCPKCNKHFPSEFELQRHDRTHEICLCDICGKTYEITYIKHHLQTHNTHNPYKCKLCTKVFKTAGALCKHKRSHFPKHRISTMCQVCGKIFRNESIRLHMRIHSGERPEVCEICGAAFRRKDHLRNHKKTHMHSTSYQCPICNIPLSNKSYRKHITVMHGGEKTDSFPQSDKLNCLICQKQFKSRGFLEDHYRMHAGQKIYSCEECGKTFGTKIVLMQHKQTHLDYDQLPNECDICNKKFRRRENLRNHRRIHTGEKPFACPICQRPFRVRGEMVKHIRVHKQNDERKISKSFSESTNITDNNSEDDFSLHDSSNEVIIESDMPDLE